MAQIMTAEDLLRLKKKIEATKESLAQLKGQETQLMERLKKEYNCNSLEQAETKLANLTASIKEMGVEIQEKQEKLRADFPQLFEDEDY